MRLWLARHGRGFLPVGEEAQRAHQRMEIGECSEFKIIRIRDPDAHRRYWALMTLCAANCERIELDHGAVMVVHSKDDVHTAVKLLTGHYDTIFDSWGRPAFRIPRSTSFDAMTAEEWNAYWPRVLDVVQERILPGVQIPAVETEILQCMGMAA